MIAVIRNESDSGWIRYSQPRRVLVARQAEAVIPALREVEACSHAGFTAIGFLAYEAAMAFDPAYSCQQTDMPLLLFGIFSDGEITDLQDSGDCMLALAPECGKPQWTSQLQRVKEHLRNGDSYQVNLTQRLRGFCNQNPEELFASLYAAQPSPLAAYLQWGDLSVCSVSPELFFSLRGRRIVMEPMKGTRPRSSDPSSDQALRAELLSSEKERAENLMIVDMVRNDLGRIAEPGSIRAEQLFTIVELPTVWQQVSRVQATTSANLVELFQALFPCASVTGAPKANTMRIIKTLEDSPRGVYTGAIGVVRPNRHMQFNVAIRTLVVNRNTSTAEYGVGSGIVWDSDTDSEWQETLLKSRVLNRGLEGFKLLETMRYEPGQGVLRRDRHLRRLRDSADYFGFHLDANTIAAALDELQSGTGCKVRLLVAESGEYDIQTSELPVNTEPVRLKLAAKAVDSRDNFLRHKTTQRRVYEAARQSRDECDDVILWNERGEITETTIYNLFLQIDGELLTPALACGLLAGTCRQALIDAGKAREARLTREDLNRAQRIFVGNSVRGLNEAILISH